jgi:uncharacterized membrane protein (UPF0127 family)
MKARLAMNPILRWSLPLLGLVFSGCLAALPGRQSLTAEQACLISTKQALPITIEVARTSAERSSGLMGRETLAESAGMLFVYSNECSADHSFWMYQTLIPLDIAYLDREGTIRAIRQMDPCRSDQGRNCPTYEAGVPFHLALEMNQGYFEDQGLKIGDRLSLRSSDCR